MMKMKLLTVILFILGAAGAATAAEVINVDLNGYNSTTPYVGNGAYDVGDDAVWTVFYGGFGIPVGSARSEGIAEDWQSMYCSVYAAQVWLGDDGVDHGYQWGSGLMDDGFDANEGASPKINIYGQDAYQGRYDIYVYGRDAGSFTLDANGVTTTQTVAGDANAGQFELGHNYVVFSNVDVNNSDPALLTLTYTNKLNGLQLVKLKSPVSVGNGITIPASSWDVAGERNTASADNERLFGPDTFGGSIGYIEPQEFMAYDFTVDDVNQGQYQIALDVNTNSQYVLMAMNMYLDDRYIGDVNYKMINPPAGKTTTVTANLFAGNHTVKWRFPSGYDWGFNIVDVNFVRVGDVVISNCGDVRNYGLTLPADFTATDTNSTPDCGVNIYDLDALAGNWLKQ